MMHETALWKSFNCFVVGLPTENLRCYLYAVYNSFTLKRYLAMCPNHKAPSKTVSEGKKDVSVSIKMKRSDLEALLGAAEKHWPGASKFMTQSGKILALAMRGAELLELQPQATKKR
jgi:hypothetical protein